MRDAAIERLSRVISDTPPRGDKPADDAGKPFAEIHISLAEGWSSLILLALVVYSTIWCIQAGGWSDYLGVLTFTTALGLIAGVLAAKQRRLARLLLHMLALVSGILLAFWLAAVMYDRGNLGELFNKMRLWIVTVSTGAVGNTDAVFFFFIVALSFLLAYASAWLVYRTRNPWLMVVANAIVLLINLNNESESFIIFLIIFLISALLLLLRFNLYESMQRWKKQGLRYAEDLGWEVMQAGILISIGILIFSWILPGNYADPTVSQIWNANSNPWTQVQNTWNRVISINGGSNPANRGNFRDTLVLGGNPNLTNEIVFTVQGASIQDRGQYISSLSYDTYDGNTWMDGPVDTLSIKANAPVSNGEAATHQSTQKVTVVNPPGEQSPYLLGPSAIVSVSVASKIQTNHQNGVTIDWQAQNGYLVAGSKYSVTSNVSSADEQTLRSVPMPQDSPQIILSGEEISIPVTYYYPATLNTYTQLPKLDPRISNLARQLTAGKATMYDKVVALETYLRSHYSYSTDIHRPSEEGVSWFLFDNPNKNGFCNYFSAAMTVMARSLGIPTRVVVGYTNGTYDAKNNQNVIRGTDAHSWTQVYFAGYGWINFEPSAGFAQFSRPQPNQFPTTNANANGGNSPNVPIPSAIRSRLNQSDNAQDPGSAAVGGAQVRSSLGIALGGFVLLLLFACLFFSLWWHRLFRKYGLSTQLYGRICILASWAGIQVKRSQTPYEYMQELAHSTPKDAEMLVQLGDIYVRDCWADPASEEHPRYSGEVEQLPGLWKDLQSHLFLYVARHPYFLRWLPQKVWQSVVSLWKRRRAKRVPDIEDL